MIPRMAWMPGHRPSPGFARHDDYLPQYVMTSDTWYNTERTNDHGAARRQVGMLLARELTERVIGLAIKVHGPTGRGTLEVDL